jgi:hypothetical protein
MIVLDTDCLSFLNRENITQAARLQRKLDEFPPEELFTTIITFDEQMRGWLHLLPAAEMLKKRSSLTLVSIVF